MALDPGWGTTSVDTSKAELEHYVLCQFARIGNMRDLPLSTPERSHSNSGSPKGLTCWLAECNAFVVPMQRNLWADATHEVMECNARPDGMQRNRASSSSNRAVPI